MPMREWEQETPFHEEGSGVPGFSFSDNAITDIIAGKDVVQCTIRCEIFTDQRVAISMPWAMMELFEASIRGDEHEAIANMIVRGFDSALRPLGGKWGVPGVTDE